METNRVGVTVTTPPAGTQDIIAINQKNGERLKFEVSKPILCDGYDFMKEFKGKSLNEQVFQKVINTLIENNFDVFLENSLATAEHETFEEHGVDLRRNIGRHNDLVLNMFDFEPQTIAAKRGNVTQKIYVAHLKNNDSVDLSYTDKIEEKIQINKGKKFYEKGMWGSLEEFKLVLAKQKEEFESLIKDLALNEQQQQLALAELRAFSSRVELIEKLEATVVSNLVSQGYVIQSNAYAEEKLQYVPIHLSQGIGDIDDVFSMNSTVLKFSKKYEHKEAVESEPSAKRARLEG